MVNKYFDVVEDILDVGNIIEIQHWYYPQEF